MTSSWLLEVSEKSSKGSLGKLGKDAYKNVNIREIFGRFSTEHFRFSKCSPNFFGSTNSEEIEEDFPGRQTKLGKLKLASCNL